MLLKLQVRYDFIVIFFIVFFSLYSIKTGIVSLSIDGSEMDFFKNILNIVLVIFSLISIVFLEKKSSFILYFIFVFLFLYNVFIVNNNAYFGYIFTISLLILSSQIKWNDLIKVLFFSSCISLIFIFLMTVCSDYYTTIDTRFGERFTAGFKNSNSFAQYLVMLLSTFILYCASRLNRKLNLFLISSFVFMIVMYLIMLTISRTAIILSILYYVLFVFSLFFKSKIIYRKKLSIILLCSTLFIIVFQFYTTISFSSSPLCIFLNSLLTGRIWLANGLYLVEGFPNFILGINIDNYFPLDFYFIANIYSQGIIPFLVMSLIVIKKLFNTKLSLLMGFTIFCMLIETITETYFSVPFFSIALFIIFHKDDSDERYKIL